MVYLYGVLALVLSLFTALLVNISFKGKKIFHDMAAVIAASVAAPAGYYAIAFVIELGKILMGSSP